MKLLLFSDLHRDMAAATALVARAAAPDIDVVIGAGDFATKRKGLRDTLDVLRAITAPTVLVPGNAESDEELRKACADWSAARVLHGDECEIDGVTFFGVGGAVPVTPFGSWSFDLTEEAAMQLLDEAPWAPVLVVHSPPIDCCDRDSSGRPIGSWTIREMIERSEPPLVVCGHVHASWGSIESIGVSPVVNAGPQGIVWDLEAARPVP